MQSAIVENGTVVNVIVGEIDGSIPCAEDVSIGWSYDGEAFSAPPAPPPEPIDLAAYARDLSWRTRIDGTVINGVPVRLDDGSLALINGMVALAERDGDRTFNFDSAAGIVTLTAAQAIAFAEAIGAWVQLTFDRRAAVLAAITAGAVTSVEEIDAAFVDVTAPWPDA